MKLVRDKIPEIIESKEGKKPKTRMLSDEEFHEQLIAKLLEEAEEYNNDRNPEELADILEVVFALAKLNGISRKSLEQMREKKAGERGAFEKRIFLSDVSGFS